MMDSANTHEYRHLQSNNEYGVHLVEGWGRYELIPTQCQQRSCQARGGGHLPLLPQGSEACPRKTLFEKAEKATGGARSGGAIKALLLRK